MTCEALRNDVCEANLALVRAGLVTLTWGNVSGIDRDTGVFVIKPSGADYADLRPEMLVAVDLDGNVVEGGLNPSSDTPTHLALYRAFPAIGGIAHTHSVHATAFAQACRAIPCLGTTHADHFHGPVSVARALTPHEVADAYERNTGVVIVETVGDRDPMDVPAILCAHHGPFAWGKSAAASVANSIALETVAQMALRTFQLADVGAIPEHILEKHHTRKHGPQATYGQR